MGRQIWKYALQITKRQSLTLPRGAEVLSAQNQNGVIMLWALVEPDNVKELRHFLIFGTGSLAEGFSIYVSTVQLPNGEVWHVFEAK